jgi:hypothetical protein
MDLHKAKKSSWSIVRRNFVLDYFSFVFLKLRPATI